MTQRIEMLKVGEIIALVREAKGMTLREGANMATMLPPQTDEQREGANMATMLPPQTDEQRERADRLRTMVKTAMEQFNALSPEQQREHRNAQRRSWIIGETMLENPSMTRADAERLADECLREAGYN